MKLVTCSRCGKPFSPGRSKRDRERCDECRTSTPTDRTPIPRPVRRAVLTPGAICHWCPEPAVTLDHLKEAAKGGKSTEDNLVPSCGKCNSRRGGKLSAPKPSMRLH